jgi:transcriptional regulator with XRE-family HTH domain
LRGAPASTTSTDRRDLTSISAPFSPAAPPPTTTTSYRSPGSLICITSAADGMSRRTCVASKLAEVANYRVMDDDLDRALASVGPRLGALRRQRQRTLTELAADTGISISTLSRLESGTRRPTLELLLPLAKAHGVTLDELVDAPPTGDPRVHLRPVKGNGMTMLPLTRHAGGIQAYKMVIPARKRRGPPEPRAHEGYEWIYVLNGRLRLVIAEHDLVLTPGEAAEFDTRMPHWFGAADEHAVEFLSLFGRQGERMHVRARSSPRSGSSPAREGA